MTSPNNPFEAYNIQHLSPSACNTFIGSQASFVLERLMGKRSQVGAAAHRGTAVEDGVVQALLNDLSTSEAIKIAQDTFSKLTALSGDPRRAKEQEAVPEMVKQALDELRVYGKPSSTQGYVSWNVEGLAVPIIGYYDVAWEEFGVVLDLKTTHALPSKIKVNHARQVSLYAICLGEKMSARVTYITPKKVATYEIENVPEHLRALEKIALTIQNFLAISPDAKELASFVAPDIDSFYFSDPLTRQAAFEVWGL